MVSWKHTCSPVSQFLNYYVPIWTLDSEEAKVSTMTVFPWDDAWNIPLDCTCSWSTFTTAVNLIAYLIIGTLTVYFNSPTPTQSVRHCGHFCSLFSWWHFLSISPPILLAHSAMWWEDELRCTVNFISVKPVSSGRGSRGNICWWERGHTLGRQHFTVGDKRAGQPLGMWIFFVMLHPNRD